MPTAEPQAGAGLAIWSRLIDALTGMPWSFWAVVGCALVAVLWVAFRDRRAPRDLVSRLASPYVMALHAWLAGRFDSAERHLRRVLELDPNHVDAALLLGNLFREQGKLTRALLVHRQLLLRSDLSERQRVDALAALLADALAADQDVSALTPLAQGLLELAPAHPLGLEVRVEACRRSGDLGRALRLFEAAERHRLAVGGSGSMGGKGASADAERVIESRLTLFLSREGDALRAAGHDDAARRYYRRALRHDEDHAAPYMGLAALAAAQGNEREALRWYRRASRRTEAELVIDGLERLDGAAADAMIGELADRGLDRDPERHGLRRALIGLYRRRGNTAMAFESAREAIARGDRSPGTLRIAAELARETRSTADALTLLLDALPPGNDPWSCRRCGAPTGRHDWRCDRCGAWESLEPVAASL